MDGGELVSCFILFCSKGMGRGSALEGANQEEGKRKTIGENGKVLALVCNLFVFLPSRWGGKKKKGLLLIFATL